MNTDLKPLFDLLDRAAPEVSGREVEEPPAETESRLKRFAAGACDEQERAQICELLRLHPAWLQWIAERVKQARARVSRVE